MAGRRADTLRPVTVVELHMISDATGATAKRLVQALEAQFPDQEFEDVVHPMVETVDDLRLAVERAKGRPAVIVYTIVKPELRDAMHDLCRRAKVHYCDILRQPIDSVAKVSGQAAKMTPGARPPLDSNYFRRMAAIEFAVKYDDGVGGGLDAADIVHPMVETVDDLRLAVERAKGRPAVIVYTIVKPELRDAMHDLCRRAKVHYCDILRQPIDSVAKVSGQTAKMRPGARAPLDSSYFRRIAAIEFAVKYDDGMGGGLDEADVVLVGVSRTSKTPLSIYLGYLGYKAANVPVVKGIKPPAALFEIDQSKIVGLTIDADRLAEIRADRARRLGSNNRRYQELVEIYDELEEAEALHRKLGCPVIEISELSIEETAARIIAMVERQQAATATAS